MTSDRQLSQVWPGTWREYLLYDGGCGICGKLADKVRPLLERKGIGVEKLQARWALDILKAQHGIEEREAYAEIRLISKDGRLYSGPDVYRYAMKRYIITYPIYILSLVPGLRFIFNRTYHLIADNRHLISKTCGFDPK